MSPAEGSTPEVGMGSVRATLQVWPRLRISRILQPTKRLVPLPIMHGGGRASNWPVLPSVDAPSGHSTAPDDAMRRRALPPSATAGPCLTRVRGVVALEMPRSACGAPSGPAPTRFRFLMILQMPSQHPSHDTEDASYAAEGGTAGHHEAEHDAAERDEAGRLLLVSNRLPVTIRRRDDELIVERSVGGLATGLSGPHARANGIWIGWPGLLDDIDATERAALGSQLSAMRAVPVELTARDVEIFYDHISNSVLWPAFHDRLDRLPLMIEGWETYESVNAQFADVVAAHYQPGDMIWVHDYQLLRLPALLRERLPDARIGFFLHIPFPTSDAFAALPARRWLLEGMLGADLVGFHTAEYRTHFRTTARRFLEDVTFDARDRDVLNVGKRRVRLGVFPMGIDVEAISAAAATEEVDAARSSFKEGVLRLFIGVDRLDYSKGIPRRLLAFEQLLARHPEWHENVRLVQVAVPTRVGVAEYQTFRDQLDALVGRINGAYGTPTWTPIHYLYRSVDEATLLGLYRAADVMLVTPVRDGMNLVAKEFVAARADEDGVLILSEFAGAAAELRSALLVNPYDVVGMSEAMHRALLMAPSERRRRMRALQARVRANTAERWTRIFLEQLRDHEGGATPDAPPHAASVRVEAGS